jgi:taurine dioxygenase
MTTTLVMAIVPSGAALGAEVRGIDLSTPLNSAAFSRIEEAFNHHSVLCFRDQNLNEEQFLAFMARFDKVEKVPISDFAHPNYPDIFFVSNIRDGDRSIGHDDAGAVWHTDMSYSERPPRISALHAREVPFENGIAKGDTHFASTAAAYDSLSDADKHRIDDLFALHDLGGRRASRKKDPSKKTDISPELELRRKKQPNVPHPVVRIHPVTGRKCLYVTKGECVGIDGLEEEEALTLIDRLARHIYRPPYRHTHKWRVGDLLMWDNCAVQHIATFDYKWPEHRRLMWRITVGAAPTH